MKARNLSVLNPLLIILLYCTRTPVEVQILAHNHLSSGLRCELKDLFPRLSISGRKGLRRRLPSILTYEENKSRKSWVFSGSFLPPKEIEQVRGVRNDLAVIDVSCCSVAATKRGKAK